MASKSLAAPSGASIKHFGVLFGFTSGPMNKVREMTYSSAMFEMHVYITTLRATCLKNRMLDDHANHGLQKRFCNLRSNK